MDSKTVHDEEEVTTALVASSFCDGFTVLSSQATSNKIHSLHFSDVTYLPIQTKKQRKADPHPSPLLNNCYGSSKPKEMLAVLGPSLEAQTALLRVLAGKRFAINQLTRGTFTANESVDLFSVVRAAHVEATPIHLKTSTVQEEFQFACELRMPNNPSSQTRKEVIQDLINSLGLQDKAGKQIKTLSAGELKRVAIGVELLSMPNLLLVDQPSTGEDRKQDWETMQILQTIARLEICQVVVTLSAPAAEIFASVAPHILLLSAQGETMSCGTARTLLEYVESKHRINTTHLAPGDFLLLCAEYAKETWPKQYNNTVGTAAYVIAPPPIRKPLRNVSTQFALLCAREAKYVAREYKWLLVRFGTVGSLLALIAIMFVNGAKQNGTAAQVGAHFGSFIFPMLMVCCGGALPLAMILQGFRLVMVREQESGESYSLLAALLCKFITEMVANFALTCMSVAILYWSIGWHTPYWWMVLALFITLESCCSYSFVFAMTAKSAASALANTGIILGPQMLFFGAVAQFALMPSWLAWINYVCNMTWGIKILVATEFDPQYCESQTACYMWNLIKTNDWMNTDDVWMYYIALVVFFVVYRVLGYYYLSKEIRSKQ